MEKEKIYQFYALSESDSPQEYRYVGVTSNSINSRFSQHKYCATHPEKCGLPVHKWMASVYKNGGTVICTKIDECIESEWEDREIYLITTYKQKYKLLNIDEGGKGVITEEKRSKSSIQRSSEGHYKKIVLLNKLGEVVGICQSIKEACEKYHLSNTAIGNVLNGRSKTTKGYYVLLYDTFIQENFDAKTYIQEINNTKSSVKLVYRFTLEGNLMDCYESLTGTARQLSFDKDAISRAIKKKTIYKESYWSNNYTIDITEFEKLFKYSYNGKLFKTQKEIGDYLGLKECTVNNAIRKSNPLRGYLIEVL